MSRQASCHSIYQKSLLESTTLTGEVTAWRNRAEQEEQETGVALGHRQKCVLNIDCHKICVLDLPGLIHFLLSPPYKSPSPAVNQISLQLATSLIIATWNLNKLTAASHGTQKRKCLTLEHNLQNLPQSDLCPRLSLQHSRLIPPQHPYLFRSLLYAQCIEGCLAPFPI